jgi:hypothetical protein
MVSVSRVDERRTLPHRGRGFGRRQPLQPGLCRCEDIVDSASLDPAIVPRFWSAESSSDRRMG